MSKVRIVTDRASDLPDNIAAKYGIEIAEMDVAFGEDVYYGGKGITIEDFYARMKKEKELPKTSCPSPDKFLEIYKKEDRFGEDVYYGGKGITIEDFYARMKKEKELPKTSCPSPDKFLEIYKKEDSDVLVLTLTSKLSATYNCAVLANDMYNEEEHTNRVKVIDTMSGSIGQGILAVYAAQLAEQGKNLDEISEEIEKLIDNTKFIGVLQTLENAIKGGRISKLAGSIINTFNFKALVQIDDGLVKPFDKARGENGSMKKLVDLFLEGASDTENKTLFIGHSNCLQKAEKVRDMILERKSYREVVFCGIGTVMGTYTSDGCVLLNAVELPELIDA